MKRRPLIASAVLLSFVILGLASLAGWKRMSLAAEASAAQPEMMEAVSAALAAQREHQPTLTAIGTVTALRSVTLRNELPGTVRHVNLSPGKVVEPGTVLVRLDVSAERAELAALEAQAALAASSFERTARAGATRAASDQEVDRARAERDMALANVDRTRAIIARKTVRAPFRARVGIADVHVGQYLDQGTLLTTLQGVDDAAYVDFAVPQAVAAGLRAGGEVQVTAGGEAPITARIVALDARVDPDTRNATVRARVDGIARAAVAPGASVRVTVPVSGKSAAVAVPVTALRKGPGGDHVFVLVEDGQGKTRAQQRRVQSGAMVGDEILIHEGLEPGELVAASGSFKLRDGALVALSEDPRARTAAK